MYGHARRTEHLVTACSTGGHRSRTVWPRVWRHRVVLPLTLGLSAVCYTITSVTCSLLTMRLEWHSWFSTVIVYLQRHCWQREQLHSKQKILQNLQRVSNNYSLYAVRIRTFISKFAFIYRSKGDVAALLVGRRTCNSQVDGSSPGRVAGRMALSKLLTPGFLFHQAV